MLEYDVVNHPKHYTSHRSGVECIELIDTMSVCTANSLKYLFRKDLKGATKQDVLKSIWYLRHEISLIERDSFRFLPKLVDEKLILLDRVVAVEDPPFNEIIRLIGEVGLRQHYQVDEIKVLQQAIELLEKEVEKLDAAEV